MQKYWENEKHPKVIKMKVGQQSIEVKRISLETQCLSLNPSYTILYDQSLYNSVVKFIKWD